MLGGSRGKSGLCIGIGMKGDGVEKNICVWLLIVWICNEGLSGGGIVMKVDGGDRFWVWNEVGGGWELDAFDNISTGT